MASVAPGLGLGAPSNVSLYKFSFYPCTVRIWNQLPAAAVLATSPTAFQEAALPAIRDGMG